MLQTISTTQFNRADMAALLYSLPPEEQQWTMDYLYNIMLHHSKDGKRQDVDYSTMPGQFSDEEKRQRMLQSYESTGATSIEEVEEMLLAI